MNNQYLSLIQEIANKYHVDPNLVANVVRQESGFNPNAHNPSGAGGLMQLMPGTARELGVRNVYDPRQNLEGGVKYLAQQMKMFHNDPRMALAAYNAGPGNVQKYHGLPPFRETQNYVHRILDQSQNFFPHMMAQAPQTPQMPTMPKPFAMPPVPNILAPVQNMMRNTGMEPQDVVSLIDGMQMRSNKGMLADAPIGAGLLG